MAEKRLIDLSTLGIGERNPNAFNDSERAYGWNDLLKILEAAPTVDAVEVVRCKECRFAKPYERMDGKTGYYCQFCGHSFKYGTNWERLYNPIKESDDFCSCGERKESDGNG